MFPRTLAHNTQEVPTPLTPPVALRLQAAGTEEQPGLNELNSFLLTCCPNMYPKHMSGEGHRGLLTLVKVANIAA